MIGMRASPGNFHVAIALSFGRPDSRLRLSGALRFLAPLGTVDVRLVDTSSSSFLTEVGRVCDDWTVDGLIFTKTAAPGDLIRHFAKRKSPKLAILDGPRDFNRADVEVRMDVRKITDAVCELLTRRGFRQLSFCGTDNPEDKRYSDETERSFVTSAADRMRLPAFHEQPGLSYSENMERGAQWIASLPKPCGIMCYSDALARDLLNACNYAHVRVPEQVAIVGLDDAPEICDMTRPTLSSVLPDFEMSGYLAAKSLYDALRGKRRKSPVLKKYGLRTLTERGSTQDLRGSGRFVTAALDLIRQTRPGELTAEAVARKLNISRRLLEMHFKKVVGHGIHAEINRVRLEAIHERLRTTHDSIGHIAESCGFKTPTAAQIAFRKRYGLSMRDYRFSS